TTRSKIAWGAARRCALMTTADKCAKRSKGPRARRESPKEDARAKSGWNSMIAWLASYPRDGSHAATKMRLPRLGLAPKFEAELVGRSRVAEVAHHLAEKFKAQNIAPGLGGSRHRSLNDSALIRKNWLHR